MAKPRHSNPYYVPMCTQLDTRTNFSLSNIQVAAIHLFNEMMDVFGPLPDPDVTVDTPMEGKPASRAPSLMQQHDAYLSGMLRPAFQQPQVDPAYVLAAFELVANAVRWLTTCLCMRSVVQRVHVAIYPCTYACACIGACILL